MKKKTNAYKKKKKSQMLKSEFGKKETIRGHF